MLTSLAFIFLFGLLLSAFCKLLKLPSIIGMLFTGILLGPHVLNLLDNSILSISGELRQIALIIILLRAGFSLNIGDLKKVGRPAVMMSFVPASFEILGFFIFAPILLGVTRMEAGLMGAVLGAVSPAIVVPRMVYLLETKFGTKESIPQLIMAGSSCDDIFVIVLFTTFTNIVQGGTANIVDFINIPISIITGILVGIVIGTVLSYFFEFFYQKEKYIRNSLKLIIILAISFLLVTFEKWLQGIIAFSGLLAIISMACTLKAKSINFVSARLGEKFGKLWLAAEILLFVLVGAAVDIRYTLNAGYLAIFMIFIALAFRSIGVFICTLGTKLNFKERLFCVFAYLPKATVQAAIGSIPLSLGLSCGNIILSVAVLGIIITAPLGTILIDNTYKIFLKKDKTMLNI